MIFNLDDLLCSRKICEDIFFLMSLIFTLMPVTQIHLYLLLAVKASSPADSLKQVFSFFFYFAGGREVKSYAFDSSILLTLLGHLGTEA